MLNLLPWRDDEAKRIKRKQVLVIMTVLVVNLIFMLGSRFFLLQKIEKMTRANQKKIKAIAEENKIKVSLMKEFDSYKAFYIKDRLLNRQQKITDAFILISHHFPVNCYVTSLLCNDKGIVMEGIINDLNKHSLAVFADNLKKNKNIKVKNVDIIKSGEYMIFTLAIVF